MMMAVARDGDEFENERCLFHRGHCIVVAPVAEGRSQINITGPVIIREEVVGYSSTHPRLDKLVRTMLDGWIDD